ncbi:TonB-dependent receptor plug domain-containing protein [Candidatus Pelagibacter sp.]|nr:TonB-dependent receptor plug domain-containing protein [Candidatus Pelagibacter sp.]
MKIIKLFLILIISIFTFNASALESCKWNNKKGVPCLTISKTPNTSEFNQGSVNKIIITKQDIINSGAVDTNDVLKLIPGLDVFQSGQKGQQTSIFTRGSESNHTLVLLNGIAINDQSATDGLHDFGQDFVQTIQQIEIYKGANGAHFGPSAIAGAVNFITDIDYTNSYSASSAILENLFRNNSVDGNYSKITDNGWHLNFKGAANQSETNSAIAKGNEDDSAKNYQVNLNGIKWINDNLKFKSTLYSRKTKADYDGSATDEKGYVADNRMYALQSGFEHRSQNSENNLIFHYHNYDREYHNDTYLDEYYSESLVVKADRSSKINNKFSFGFGSEYKYDWGSFENRGSYTASTKGHMKDLGFFANAGYKINENQILSIHGRTDDHNTTGRNQTYKLNFIQILGQFKFGATHSTGLRNPSLYELYGSDNYGIGGNTNLNPEKSETNELYGEYNFSETIKFTSTGYRAKVFDRIESNAAYSMHENELIDINQEGLESELLINGSNQKIALFTNFSKSRKANGQAQARRPDLSYGANYSKKIESSTYGPFSLNLNYKYTGQFIDYDGSKNSRQKSTDLVDLSIKKNWFGSILSINLSNLLNERYEKPAQYSQDGRQLRIGIRKAY